MSTLSTLAESLSWVSKSFFLDGLWAPTLDSSASVTLSASLHTSNLVETTSLDLVNTLRYNVAYNTSLLIRVPLFFWISHPWNSHCLGDFPMPLFSSLLFSFMYTFFLIDLCQRVLTKANLPQLETEVSPSPYFWFCLFMTPLILFHGDHILCVFRKH